MKRLYWGTLLALVTALVAVPAAQDHSAAFDFALKRSFLQDLREAHTILPKYEMDVHARSRVKDVGQDCEAHLAASLTATGVVDPDAVVAEPPNLCAFAPDGTAAMTAATKTAWQDLLDAQVVGRHCTVTGFPRLFTEHATGTEAESNPNHVFEIHPALSIDCGTGAPLQFTPFMSAPEGLRHIKATSAESCLATRTLAVRFKDGAYQFQQHGGVGCGNFAILEINHVHPEWTRSTGGGHSGIARVTADGTARHTLKIYTLEGTAPDSWLATMQASGTADPQQRLMHGVFTFDYFAMIKAITTSDGSFLPTSQLKTWKDIPFPLAFIIYGETQTVPWEEQ
jgi:hypothetical protein